MAGTLAPLERMASLLDAPRSRDTSPEAVKKRRRLAEALAQQATDPSGGGGSLLGAIGQGIKGFAAARMQDQADRDEADGMAVMNAALGRIGAAGGSPAPAAAALPVPPSMRPAPAAGMTRDRGGVPANIPSFVASAGQPYGISPTYMTTVADIESRGNPNAKNPSGASGLFQFMPGTARQYGLSNPFDPAASADAAARLAADNRGILRRTLGRDPTEGELYLAHQQGAGGAGKLLANPNALAADLVGRAAVVQNGGRANMSAAEFSGLWTGKYDQRAGRQAAADMPAAGAEPVSFLTDPKDPNGGYFIPPDVRAQAPAGDPSGPRPGDGMAPSPPPSTNPDLAALTAPQAMGPAQTFLPPAEIPAPVPQVASGIPQDVPLPPVRPAAADLMAQPTTPAPAVPEPPAVAQASQPQSVPLPPARPSDAALYAQPAADMPAPGAVPAAGVAPPINPNAQDAGAGAFARRQGVDVLLGGLQDGLDRIFGGPETQARLDRRQATIAALGGTSQPSARAQQLAAVLDPAGASGGAPALAMERGAPAADPRRAATIAALDPAGAQAGPSAAPAMPQGGGQVPAASIPQPTSYAQAGGMTDARRQDLLAIANSGYATPQVRQFALDQLNPKLSVHDAGDALIATDQSGNLVRTYPKTKAADFGEVGRDAYGNPIMGYRDYGQRSVSVPQVPGVTAGQAPVDMNGRPIPQGVDPKVVREKQSQSYVEGTLPASSSSVAELRKEVGQRPEFKNYSQAVPIYRAMVETADRNTKASDLNLIYGLGKIMDPGSVVREGEMVMANNTQGIQERLNGMISAVQGGALLTPRTRQALMAEAYGRMQAYENEYDAARTHYTDIAKRNRMNPDDVVQGFERAKPWQAAQSSAAPGGAVEMLRANPALREQFDAKYGPGSADRALGRR